MSMALPSIDQPKKSPTDLIWIQTAFLGDIILNTGAFDLAAQHFPGVRQHVVTTKTGAGILDGLDSVFSVQVFEKRKANFFGAMLRLSRNLRQQLYDPERTIIVQPHRSVRSSLLASFLRFPVVTYFETDLGFLGARTSRVSVLHEAVRVALPLELLGIPREHICAVKPRLIPQELTGFLNSGTWQNALLNARKTPGAKLIGVAPGSQWGTKRWTPEGYAALCNEILKSPEWHVLLLGGADEKKLIDDIAGRLQISGKTGKLYNLAGKTSIADLSAIFPMLDLIVANDSSPVQFGSAFQVPTVAIFGPTVPAMGFGPLAPGSRVIEIEMPCRPCSDHGPQVCPLGHFKCMRDLNVGRVFEACVAILNLSR